MEKRHERQWSDIAEMGLPSKYAGSKPPPEEEIQREALKWINSREYNIDPIAFIKRYEGFAASGNCKPLAREKIAYTIVRNYTLRFFKLTSIDYAKL